MTQGEKELLLKDLCARLPYGVKAHIEHDTFYDEIEPYDGTVDTNTINDLLRNEKLEVKPYLRPMSSMTEEEIRQIYEKARPYIIKSIKESELEIPNRVIEITNNFMSDSVIIDELNKRHIDYRGLIEKGLALEAPEDMYR